MSVCHEETRVQRGDDLQISFLLYQEKGLSALSMLFSVVHLYKLEENLNADLPWLVRSDGLKRSFYLQHT